MVICILVLRTSLCFICIVAAPRRYPKKLTWYFFPGDCIYETDVASLQPEKTHIVDDTSVTFSDGKFKQIFETPKHFSGVSVKTAQAETVVVKVLDSGDTELTQVCFTYLTAAVFYLLTMSRWQFKAASLVHCITIYSCKLCLKKANAKCHNADNTEYWQQYVPLFMNKQAIHEKHRT